MESDKHLPPSLLILSTFPSTRSLSNISSGTQNRREILHLRYRIRAQVYVYNTIIIIMYTQKKKKNGKILSTSSRSPASLWPSIRYYYIILSSLIVVVLVLNFYFFVICIRTRTHTSIRAYFSFRIRDTRIVYVLNGFQFRIDVLLDHRYARITMYSNSHFPCSVVRVFTLAKVKRIRCARETIFPSATPVFRIRGGKKPN